MKPVFYVNNLTPSKVLNTLCEIIHIESSLHWHYNLHGPKAVHILQTIQSI